MRSFFIRFLVCILAMSAFLVYGPGGVYYPQPFSENVVFIVEKGEKTREISKNLVDRGLIFHDVVFYAAAFLTNKLNRLRSGEYLIPARATPAQIIEILASGKGIIHKLTIPEGRTVHDIAEIVKEAPILSGDIVTLPEEGQLLPETYTYTYGDTRQDLINRMTKAMNLTLQKIWHSRPVETVLKTSEEALILASIVEKETGIASERSQVAAVFSNRLRLGMKLQADPTVIYGLTLGKEKLNRPLTKEDLQSESPYNTYVIQGLPPKPIACPGKASLEAVIRPGDFSDLYFVADGTGGHSFSQTLEKHNASVQTWRKIEKSRK